MVLWLACDDGGHNEPKEEHEWYVFHWKKIITMNLEYEYNIL